MFFVFLSLRTLCFFLFLVSKRSQKSGRAGLVVSKARGKRKEKKSNVQKVIAELCLSRAEVAREGGEMVN